MSENLVLPRPRGARLGAARSTNFRSGVRAVRLVLTRTLLLASLAVALYDAALHGLAWLMGHDAYMAAAGLIVRSETVPPSGAVPEMLRPIVFPSFETWAAYDLFWFLVHAAVAAALAGVMWATWSPEKTAR